MGSRVRGFPFGRDSFGVEVPWPATIDFAACHGYDLETRASSTADIAPWDARVRRLSAP